MVDWRRNKVQQLLVRGYSQWDVVEELQIDQSTVSRDVQYLRHQARIISNEVGALICKRFSSKGSGKGREM